MAVIVALFGLALTALGAVGVASPATLMGLVASAWRSPRGLYLAVVIRLVFGVVLVVAAPTCRFSEAVRIIGILSIVAAVIAPVVGFDRLRSFIDWWGARPAGFIRAWALVAAAFGIFLVYAGA